MKKRVASLLRAVILDFSSMLAIVHFFHFCATNYHGGPKIDSNIRQAGEYAILCQAGTENNAESTMDAATGTCLIWQFKEDDFQDADIQDDLMRIMSHERQNLMGVACTRKLKKFTQRWMDVFKVTNSYFVDGKQIHNVYNKWLVKKISG